MDNIEFLKQSVEVLTQRLDLHDQMLDLHEKHRDAYVSDSYRYRAATKALLSMISELAAQSGLSAAHVESCFGERVRHFHDLFLRTTENTDPMIAGLADDRLPTELPENESFQPLFPRESL